MATIFSESQLSAINTRDRSLLVSAAAGSGKTTTLTERIIRSLLDENHPESIRNMLIVTFTNASVDDLRGKIHSALKAAIEKNPGDTRLESELYMLPSARIMTIDSFCAEIVRTNADKIGISPSYRIAESAEIEILTGAIMEALIGDAFSGKLEGTVTAREIEILSDCLTDSKKTKNLGEVFRMLYERSKSSVMGVKIFDFLAKRYTGGADLAPEDSFFGKELMRRAREALEHYAHVLEALADKALTEGDEKCALDANCYCQYAEALRHAKDLKSYSDMRGTLALITPPKMKPVKEDDKTPTLTLLRAEYGVVKNGVKELISSYFSYDEGQWRELLSQLGEVVSSLARFLEKFDEVYTLDKRRRGICEHSDVERYAYLTLYDENGNTTDVADSYKSRFTSVYIDEYQDVNELQDAIFRAVARDNNRFMVGDIKQSIYSFRSARPDIFKNMKTSFTPLAEAECGEPSTIFLSQNFRCDKGVVDFVNGVFDTMFSLVGESVGYTKEDALVFSKKYKDGKEPPYTPAEIYILDRPVADEDDEEPTEKSFGPAFCAEKIRTLIECGTLADGGKITPSDIAIVLRKKSGAEDFARALAELGIKAEVKDKDGFFTSAEVLIALCLLNAVDNPRRDIYLAGLLCSPLYSFTPSELLKYRKAGGDCLYTSLKDYLSANPCEEKLSSFLNSLNKYREICEGMEAHELIYRLFTETGLFALAASRGERDRLLLFYNYARKFEGASLKGLSSFIKYLNEIVEKNRGFDEGGADGDGDAVKIVTAHSSKGLEYPIVFFAEASRDLICLDARARVLYEEQFGISFCLRAPGGLALAENPINSIMRDRMKERYFEEELRVLYVALTRAREKLFVVGDIDRGTDRDSYLDKIDMKRATLTPFGARRISSFLDIITTAKTNAKLTFTAFTKESGEDGAKKDTPTVQKSAPIPEENIYEVLKERFEFVYPSYEMARMPAKLSVSRLYPDVLDGADENAELLIGRERRRAALPEFYTGKAKDESARGGIATHMVLQFCDFDALIKDMAGELERLRTLGFINEKTRERVREDEIALFTKSKLVGEILGANRVWRELRFNTTLPAEMFTENEERRAALSGESLFVQGVIDCLFEDGEGNLHLVDYKTDRLSPEELADESLAGKTLCEKHALQLSYYSKAVEKMFGKAPKTVRIYSLHLGKTVDVLA